MTTHTELYALGICVHTCTYLKLILKSSDDFAGNNFAEVSYLDTEVVRQNGRVTTSDQLLQSIVDEYILGLLGGGEGGKKERERERERERDRSNFDDLQTQNSRKSSWEHTCTKTYLAPE